MNTGWDIRPYWDGSLDVGVRLAKSALENQRDLFRDKCLRLYGWIKGGKTKGNLI